MGSYELFLLLLAGIALALIQFRLAPGLSEGGPGIALKIAMLALYFAFAASLFRQEVTLVVVKVGNKFGWK